jgi:hypothetical protein
VIEHIKFISPNEYYSFVSGAGGIDYQRAAKTALRYGPVTLVQGLSMTAYSQLRLNGPCLTASLNYLS